MSEPSSNAPPAEKPRRESCLGHCGCAILGIVILLILAGIALGPINRQQHQLDNSAMQIVRQIGLSMFAYSNDHDGKYPDGQSSTEVFQQLLEGNYIVDPGLFYIPMPGKTKPLAGRKLKPENVCFDVTGGVDASSSDKLPLVYLTGYKVTYTPESPATPLIKPYPRYWDQNWFDGIFSNTDNFTPGIAVSYKSNNARYVPLQNPGASDASIPNFIPPDFKPDGRTYRQLTPDGTLP